MKMVELGQVAKIDRESIIPSEIRTGTKYLGLENVYSDGSSIPVDVHEGELLSNKFVFGPNHLLYGKLRPYLNKITLPDFDGVCSTDIIPILPDAKQLDKRYLYYYLRTPWMIETAVKACSGANLPRVDPKLLAKFKIPLPPLPTQRRIAAVLDKAQALVANDRQTLALYDQLAKSLFLEMFGDLALNPRQWPTQRMVELCADQNDIKCGPFGTQLQNRDYREEGVPLWGIKQINSDFTIPTTEFLTTEKADELEQYSIIPYDIVMSRKGNVGKCALYPDLEPGVMHSDVLRIRLDQRKCDPVFATHQLRHSRAIEHQVNLVSSGAIMAGVNVTKLKEIALHVPPQQLQRAFREKLSAIEGQHAQAEQSLRQSEGLFGSLLQGAFEGSWVGEGAFKERV